MSWYVINTNIKCEEKAKRGLLEKGMTVYYPMCRRKVTISRGRKRVKAVVEKPLMIRYLFVKVGTGTCYDIRRTDGVERIVTVGYIPGEVPDEQIENLMAAEDMGMFDETRKEVSIFQPGTDVKIIEGPFEGYFAKVVEAYVDKPARISIEMFGRPTVLRVDLDVIRKVA